MFDFRRYKTCKNRISILGALRKKDIDTIDIHAHCFNYKTIPPDFLWASIKDELLTFFTRKDLKISCELKVIKEVLKKLEDVDVKEEKEEEYILAQEEEFKKLLEVVSSGDIDGIAEVKPKPSAKTSVKKSVIHRKHYTYSPSIMTEILYPTGETRNEKEEEEEKEGEEEEGEGAKVFNETGITFFDPRLEEEIRIVLDDSIEKTKPAVGGELEATNLFNRRNSSVSVRGIALKSTLRLTQKLYLLVKKAFETFKKNLHKRIRKLLKEPEKTKMMAKKFGTTLVGILRFLQVSLKPMTKITSEYLDTNPKRAAVFLPIDTVKAYYFSDHVQVSYYANVLIHLSLAGVDISDEKMWFIERQLGPKFKFSRGERTNISAAYQRSQEKEWKGKFIPGVGVDPRRFGDKYYVWFMNLCFNDLGAVVGKLYPAMGWKIEDCVGDESMSSLFKAFNDAGIPLITHGLYEGTVTSSDEMYKEEEKMLNFCHPKKWEPVLEKFPDLKLCIAHFDTMDSHEEPTSSKVIVNLMTKFKNVYTDISHSGKDKCNVDSVAQLMMSNPSMKDKVLFGSDYWLLLKDKKLVEYYEDCLVTGALVENNLVKDVSYDNCLRFLEV